MKLDFGKHKGKDISDIPTGYLSFIYDTMSPQVNEIAKVLKIDSIQVRLFKRDLLQKITDHQKEHGADNLIDFIIDELREKQGRKAEPTKIIRRQKQR